MKIRKWKEKAIHGRFYQELHAEGIDKEMSCEWIRRGSIFSETEGFMFAIQDQVIPTNNYRKMILKDVAAVDKYRKCAGRGETI